MSELEPIVTLPWLVRLRWAFFAGQLALITVGRNLLPFDYPLAVLALALLAIGNLVLARQRPRARVVGAAMLVDTVQLTLLLAASGNAANPFTVLYLVHITLSAIVLSVRWVIAIASTSIAGFALLFTRSSPHAMHLGSHLEMMWLAFTVAAVLIAYFVMRVTRAIAVQREQIAQLQARNERTERRASVIRLAASAAHELGSPLATIAIAAHEAKRHLAGSRSPLDDLELITLEVERCQEILGHLSARGADETHDDLTLGELAEAIRDHLDADAATRVDLEIDTTAARVTAPRDQLVQTICALVDNSLEATTDRVDIALLRDAAAIEITVRDRGDIDTEVLARIGSPFFTTKGAGHGLGLGVFLARAFCESRGGSLTIASERGRGTRATIRIPEGGR